jgi:hypothetical protein
MVRKKKCKATKKGNPKKTFCNKLGIEPGLDDDEDLFGRRLFDSGPGTFDWTYWTTFRLPLSKF